MSGHDAPIRLSRECLLTSEQRLDETIIRLHGELDLACEARFEEELGRLVGNATERLLLDVRDLTFVDSTGLRMLFSLNALAASNGFELVVLCSGGGPVRRVLETIGLDGMLPLKDAAQAGPAAGPRAV